MSQFWGNIPLHILNYEFKQCSFHFSAFISVIQVLPNLMWYKHNSECYILSCGRFLGVWIFCADISEHCLFHLHITYEDGTDRQFRNIVTENSDAWNHPKERIQHSHTVKAWNQSSVVSSVNAIWTEWAWVWILAGQDTSHFSKSSRPAAGLTQQPTIQWVPMFLTLG